MPDNELYMVGVKVDHFPGDDPDDPKGEEFENDPAGWVAFALLSDGTMSFPMGATPRKNYHTALLDVLDVRWDGNFVFMRDEDKE